MSGRTYQGGFDDGLLAHAKGPVTEDGVVGLFGLGGWVGGWVDD